MREGGLVGHFLCESGVDPHKYLGFENLFFSVLVHPGSSSSRTPHIIIRALANYILHPRPPPGYHRVSPRPARPPEKLPLSFVWFLRLSAFLFRSPRNLRRRGKGSSPKEMMDEIDRLKTFEPPEKSDDNKVNVKLFLEEDIRFLELDPDVSYEELIIAVGKVFIESYVIKFEVGYARVTVAVFTSHALRDTSLALRTHAGMLYYHIVKFLPCSLPPFFFPFNFHGFPAEEKSQPTLGS